MVIFFFIIKCLQFPYNTQKREGFLQYDILPCDVYNFKKLNHDHFNERPDVRDLSNVCYSLFFCSAFSLYVSHDHHQGLYLKQHLITFQH